tara:strand:- start:364 stop:1065 length:702 start_codon:yes stop_codon:yes gene_type:complete
MALPKIDLPIGELTIPSTGEKVKYRPFTVKEEKILLVGQQSGDPEMEILSSKQVVNNCLIDKDVDDLAMFDLEYILLYLRARSVNNVINFTIKDEDTDESVDLEFDIDEIKLEHKEGHSKEIAINDEYKLFLKYPTINEFVKLVTSEPNDPLIDYIMLVSCVDFIASEDEVHYFKDYNEEQINDFMESLSGDMIKKITKFFETMPRLKQEMKYTNSAGTEKTFVVEGMRSFFT